MDYSYSSGRNGFELPRYNNPRLGQNEARAAVDSWTAAMNNHGDRSYWGTEHIRAMRAYWLGALRFYRAGQTA